MVITAWLSASFPQCRQSITSSKTCLVVCFLLVVDDVLFEDALLHCKCGFRRREVQEHVARRCVSSSSSLALDSRRT